MNFSFLRAIENPIQFFWQTGKRINIKASIGENIAAFIIIICNI